MSVEYELDGKRVDAADLGGASGKLAIFVTTKKNASVDPAFFDNYLLQITVPFVSDQVRDVATEDGQIAPRRLEHAGHVLRACRARTARSRSRLR